MGRERSKGEDEKEAMAEERVMTEGEITCEEER